MTHDVPSEKRHIYPLSEEGFSEVGALDLPVAFRFTEPLQKHADVVDLQMLDCEVEGSLELIVSCLGFIWNYQQTHKCLVVDLEGLVPQKAAVLPEEMESGVGPKVAVDSVQHHYSPEADGSCKPVRFIKRVLHDVHGHAAEKRGECA